jgi:hypothetical protein
MIIIEINIDKKKRWIVFTHPFTKLYVVINFARIVSWGLSSNGTIFYVNSVNHTQQLFQPSVFLTFPIKSSNAYTASILALHFGLQNNLEKGFNLNSIARKLYSSVGYSQLGRNNDII